MQNQLSELDELPDLFLAPDDGDADVICNPTITPDSNVLPYSNVLPASNDMNVVEG